MPLRCLAASLSLGLASGLSLSGADAGPSPGAIVAMDFAGSRYRAPTTNKCTNTNSNPQTLAGVTKGGDAASVLSIVDDSAALAAIGLSGNAFKLDNSAGVAIAWADVAGPTGNANVHQVVAYVRGSGGTARLRTGFSDPANASVTLTSSYQRKAADQTTLAAGSRNAGDTFRIQVNPGVVVYFILNGLYEGQNTPARDVLVSGAPATRADTTGWATLADISGLVVTRAHTGFANAYAEDTDGTLKAFAANTPRITGKGLLLEPAATNQIVQSETMQTAPWGSSLATVGINATTAPNGEMTAEQLTANAGSGQHALISAANSVLGTTYAMSVYAKANTHSTIQVYGHANAFGTGVWATFNLAAGAVGSVGASATAQIIPLANGWYRCVVVGTATASDVTGLVVGLVPAGTAVRNPTWTATGTESVFLWGAQQEVGSAATSYIPTVAAIATRAADQPMITGLTLPAPWTLVLEAQTISRAAGTYPVAVQVDDGTNNTRGFVFTVGDNGNWDFQVNTGGVFQGIMEPGAPTFGIERFAARYAANDLAASLNRSALLKDASAAVAALSTIRFGQEAGGTSQFHGWVRSMALHPRGLNDNELQAAA